MGVSIKPLADRVLIEPVAAENFTGNMPVPNLKKTVATT